MSIVLENHIAASEKSAQELNARMNGGPARPMIGRDLEALMEMVVDIFEDMNHYVERWQTDIETGAAIYDDKEARSLLALYVRLEKTALQTSLVAKKVEGSGFEFSGKPRFLKAWREMKGIVSLPVDRVAESFAQLQRGQFKTLGEFADELSRDPGR